MINYKKKTKYDLQNIPDKEIIKHLRIELGKANSYIQELEEKTKQMNCDRCRGQIKSKYKDELKALKESIKVKDYEIWELNHQNNSYWERIKKLAHG